MTRLIYKIRFIVFHIKYNLLQKQEDAYLYLLFVSFCPFLRSISNLKSQSHVRRIEFRGRTNKERQE